MLLLVKAIRRFNVRTVLPSRIEGLGVLASNLRWSWHPPTRDLFESISPRRWAEAAEDPVKLLSRLSSDELAALAADDEFVGARRGRQRGPAPLPHARAVVPVVEP